VKRRSARLAVVALFALPPLASSLAALLLTTPNAFGYWSAFADVFASGALVSFMVLIALAFSFGVVSVDTRAGRDPFSPSPVATSITGRGVAYRMSGEENRAVTSLPLQLLCVAAAFLILCVGLVLSALL